MKSEKKNKATKDLSVTSKVLAKGFFYKTKVLKIFI